jgi:hypothetical protein
MNRARAFASFDPQHWSAGGNVLVQGCVCKKVNLVRLQIGNMGNV